MKLRISGRARPNSSVRSRYSSPMICIAKGSENNRPPSSSWWAARYMAAARAVREGRAAIMPALLLAQASRAHPAEAGEIELHVVLVVAVGVRPEHGQEMRARRGAGKMQDVPALLGGAVEAGRNADGAPVLELEPHDVERIGDGMEAEVAGLGVVDIAALVA